MRYLLNILLLFLIVSCQGQKEGENAKSTVNTTKSAVELYYENLLSGRVKFILSKS